MTTDVCSRAGRASDAPMCFRRRQTGVMRRRSGRRSAPFALAVHRGAKRGCPRPHTSMDTDDLTYELLAGATAGLNAAAGDLRLLASATHDRTLAHDAGLLADAVEREIEASARSACAGSAAARNATARSRRRGPAASVVQGAASDHVHGRCARAGRLVAPPEGDVVEHEARAVRMRSKTIPKGRSSMKTYRC